MKLFLDSSVVLAALWSANGGSAKILMLCEAQIFKGYISEEVVEEVNEVLTRKAPETLPLFKTMLKTTHLKILSKLRKADIEKAKKWIKDAKDAPILAAAKRAKVDRLITLDLKDFIRDSEVSRKSGIAIWTPGEFLQKSRWHDEDGGFHSI